MKKTSIIGLVLVFVLLSCGKDDRNNLTTLSGIYTETSPVIGRSQLRFINGNTVIITKGGISYGDEFNYEILHNTIKLTPTLDNSISTELGFEIISDSKFIIENLYPSIPENPATYMTFEREDEFVNKTTDALIIGFVTEKCYCCWGWVIKVGTDTIKAEQIPNLNPSENTVFPMKVRITIGQKTIDCSNRTINMTKLPDYYEIKECTLIK